MLTSRITTRHASARQSLSLSRRPINRTHIFVPSDPAIKQTRNFFIQWIILFLGASFLAREAFERIGALAPADVKRSIPEIDE